MRPHEFMVTLKRSGPQQVWGIRLVGGTDLNAPLIITRISVGSPASVELMRGDVLTKINEYDARDLSHHDAQNLFQQASHEIRLVIRRDDAVAAHQHALESNGSRPGSAVGQSPVGKSPVPPKSVEDGRPLLHQNFPPPAPEEFQLPLSRALSPLPHGPQAFHIAMTTPVETLPHTDFSAPRTFSPSANRDHQSEEPSEHDISNQPYRTTPLVLPGAKVNRSNLPTESYLRHHPNPAVRAPPTHTYLTNDTLMKQKLAETMVNRIVGEEQASKVVLKQFNSPIGLYSDNNIEQQIKQTVPSNGILSNRHEHVPTKLDGYKKTVVFNPANSATYQLLHEGQDLAVNEMPPAAQPTQFYPNRLVPGKKPLAQNPAPEPEVKHVTKLGEHPDNIQQSGTFKRLMMHVLGETDY